MMSKSVRSVENHSIAGGKNRMKSDSSSLCITLLWSTG